MGVLGKGPVFSRTLRRDMMLRLIDIFGVTVENLTRFRATLKFQILKQNHR